MNHQLIKIKIGGKVWKCLFRGYNLYYGPPKYNHGQMIMFTLSDDWTKEKILVRKSKVQMEKERKSA